MKDKSVTHIQLTGIVNKKTEKKKKKEEKKKKQVVYTFKDVYTKLSKKNMKNLNVGKNTYDFSSFIKDIDKSVYFEFYIDQLSYQEKTILLKEILEEYISTGEIVDNKNKAILSKMLWDVHFYNAKKFYKECNHILDDIFSM